MKISGISKLLAITAIVGTICALQSCNKVLQNLKFNLGMQTQTVTVTIPASTADSIAIGPVNTTYNVDSFIKASTSNQLGINNISSVKLASCVLTITNPTTDNNFGNFQSCMASFSSNTNATPYAISIASNPSTYATTLSLPVDTTAELKSYIGTQFTYNLSGNLRTAITAPVTCTITFTYNMIVQG